MSPSNEELLAFAQHGASLVSLIRDVSDVLDCIAVAGLAWPDPALVRDLEALADRADLAGAVTGSTHLRALSSALQCLSQSMESAPRDRAGRVAFGALNQLVLWHRLFRNEVDAVSVQAHLLSHEDGSAAAVDGTPTLSGTAHWVGVLQDEKAVRFFGVCDGRFVVFVDEWIDLSTSNPAHEPAVSRLFQARLPLSRVCASSVRLTDYPVEAQQDLWMARPHFRSVPSLIPRSEYAFGLPASTTALAPIVVSAQLSREGAVRLRVRGKRLTVSDTLTLTLTRYLLSGGSPEVSIVVLKRRERMVFLGFQSELDGYLFPHVDTHTFPLIASTLAARLQVTDGWSAWSTALLGAPAPSLDPPASDAGWAPRLGLWELTGAAPSPAAQDWARTTLLSPDLDNDALWLALRTLMLVDGLQTPEVSACWGRFSKRSKRDGVGVDLSSVCIQALLMHAASPVAADDATADLAATWLDSQVAAMALHRDDVVLPGAKSLMQLALCLAWIAPKRPTHAATLGVSLLQMRLLIVDTLWRAFALDEPTDPEALSHALWLIRFVDRPTAWFV